MDLEKVMKKLLLMTVGFAALGMAPAVAADLAPRMYTKAPVPAPVLTWGGFYLGVEGGAGSSRDAWSFDGNFGIPFGSPDGSGAVGGGVIGYNWQLPNNVVLGIEGNFDAADIKGTSPCLEVTVECRSKLDSLYSATARLGYATSGPLGPMLFYVTGGGAWTNQKLNLTEPGLNAIGSATRTGWTVGTGFEYMFAPSWSAKIEYDYYDFGSKTTALIDPTGELLPSDISSKLTVNTIKAGVNYHFGDPFRP
jgi:outer membrane immunogenic protein